MDAFSVSHWFEEYNLKVDGLIKRKLNSILIQTVNISEIHLCYTYIVIWIQLKYRLLFEKIRAKYLHEHAQHYLTFTKAVPKK